MIAQAVKSQPCKGELYSEDMPVSAAKGRRSAFAGAAARVGGGAATVRLPAAEGPAETRGLRGEP